MNERLQKLQKRKKHFQLLYLLMAVYLISALVLLYRARIPGILAALLAPVLYLVFLLPALKRFARDKRTYNLEYAYGNILEKLKIQGKNIFQRNEFDEAGLIPSQKKGFLMINGISGIYRNLSVTASEFTNYHRTDLTNPRCSRLLFLSGTFVRVRLPKNTDCNLRAVSIGLLAEETRTTFYCDFQGLKEAALPDGSLKQGFYIYTDDGRQPDKRFCEELLKLRSACRDNIAVSIKGDSAYIFLQNSFLSIDHKVYDEITPQSLHRVRCPELEAVLRFCYKARGYAPAVSAAG